MDNWINKLRLVWLNGLVFIYKLNGCGSDPVAVNKNIVQNAKSKWKYIEIKIDEME